MDNIATSDPVPGSSPNSVGLTAGKKLPWFIKGGKRPCALIAEDMNQLVMKPINAFLSLQVQILSGTNPAGTNTPYARFMVSDTNSVIELYNIGGGGSGGSGGSQIVTFEKELDDYLLCADENLTTYYVAKPWKLQRQSYDGSRQVLPDGAHQYAWVSNSFSTTYSSRTDTTTAPDGSGNLVSRSVIWPPYIQGDQLLIVNAPTSGMIDPEGNPVIWADCNSDARHWVNQEEVCYNGVAAFELYETSPYASGL